jgi:trigger factor
MDAYASRYGHYDKVETFDPEQRDMLKGDIRELDADGNTLENGITVADAVLMPQYIKVDEQKELFQGAKLGDIITFNPRKAYPDNDAEVSSLLKIDREQVGEHTGDFSYQVTEISRYVKAPVNQELFDNVYGTGNVADETAFRARIAEELGAQLAVESDFRFLRDVRSYAENKVGELVFPEELLKRVMKENNKDKEDDFVEKNFEGSIRELKWHLIKEQLVEANKVQINDDDVKKVAVEDARMQFAQYGMTQVPDEYLENYASDMLKKKENVNAYVDRAVDRALMLALKNAVHLDVKEVTLDEFRALN